MSMDTAGGIIVVVITLIEVIVPSSPFFYPHQFYTYGYYSSLASAFLSLWKWVMGNGIPTEPWMGDAQQS